MTKLFERILALNAEELLEEKDVADPEGGQAVFSRFAASILDILREEIPAISRACILTAGIRCGYLITIATSPPVFKEVAGEISRLRADVLHQEGNPDLLLTDAPVELHPLYQLPSFHLEEHLVIKLIGNDEYYGLIWLDSFAGASFSVEDKTTIKTILPIISRIISEANFSMRLQRLASPMMEARNGLVPSRQEIYQEITRQAALGLAADGAVLRIYDPETKELVAKAWYGIDNKVENPVRELICRQVFEADQGFGVAQNILTRNSFGIEVSPEDVNELYDLGVVSFMIMLLQSDIAYNKGPLRIGTLAVFHHRPHSFSLRDIRLARIFAERVADDLALLNQKDELEMKQKLLDFQGNMVTRAEIIALLMHDLGHKAIAVTEGVKQFRDACKKAIRDRRTPDAISTHSVGLVEACELLENEIGQIRRVGREMHETGKDFDVIDVIEDIRSTMEHALDRSNINFDLHPAKQKNQKSNLILHGPPGIFSQAIFNLVINSIDAQKNRAHKNTIHIHCRKEPPGQKSRIIIRYWDEGPGISYAHFPDYRDVFEIGLSSKPEGEGSGTGLPVARGLLDKYFRAEMNVLERRPPLFEIAIPIAARD